MNHPNIFQRRNEGPFRYLVLLLVTLIVLVVVLVVVFTINYFNSPEKTFEMVIGKNPYLYGSGLLLILANIVLTIVKLLD
ncbi:MAG: hypothetical protein HC859_04365 [Bacteroidia bacterium]|nr:hypothetical protein [Bacteroidia bacterium]